MLSSLAFALVVNQVAASSNLPASNAIQAMSEAICIAFLAASALSFVFGFAAARSVSAFLNCASSVARSGAGFSSERIAEGMAEVARIAAIRRSLGIIIL